MIMNKQGIKKYIIYAYSKFDYTRFYQFVEYTSLDMLVLFLSLNSLHRFMHLPHTFEHYREILFTPNRYLLSEIEENYEYSTETKLDRHMGNVEITSQYTCEDDIIPELLKRFPEYTKEQLKEHEYRMGVHNYLEILEKFLQFHASKIPYLILYEDAQGKVDLEQYFPTDDEWQAYWGRDVKIDNNIIPKYAIGKISSLDKDFYYDMVKYNEIEIMILFVSLSFLKEHSYDNAQQALQAYKNALLQPHAHLETTHSKTDQHFTQIHVDLLSNTIKIVSLYTQGEWAIKYIRIYFPEYTKEQLENYAYKMSIEDYLRILQKLLELYYAQVPYIILYQDEQGKLQCQVYQPTQEEEKLRWQVVPSRNFLDNL